MTIVTDFNDNRLVLNTGVYCKGKCGEQFSQTLIFKRLIKRYLESGS